MKAMKSLKWWQALVIAVVIGIISHIAFGFSGWMIMFVVVFIWVAESFFRPLYIIAIVFMLISFWRSELPLSASKGPWGLLQIDLWTSQRVDSVQVKADLILESQKNIQKEALLTKYQTLIQEGKVKEAIALMDSIDRLFSKEKPLEKVEPRSETRDNPAPLPRDSIFTKGIYYIDVKGVTPYNIIIYPDREGCSRYALSSETYNYQIWFSDGERVQAGPNVIVRHRLVPTFRLFSGSGDRVKLIVA